MEQWETKLLAEATLSDFISAHMLIQHWGRERVFIKNFFDGKPHVTVSEALTNYTHSIQQYSLKNFFETEKGFTKIFEGQTDSSEADSSPTFEEIEYDLGKTFRGYSDVALGYKTPEGDKILLIIERRDGNTVGVRLLGSDGRGGLMREWAAFSQKHNFYRGKKLTAGAKFLDLNNLGWDDVILPDGKKKLLKSLVIDSIKLEPVLKKNKISLKKGIMMEGGPGNGKTSAMKVIAKEAEVSVVYAQPSHLMYAKDVRAVCQMAKELAPTLLLIEDIDWIAEDRDSGDAGRVIELMNQLDGLEELGSVITIASTNDLGKIEKAVKNRPGRFDRVIKIDNPAPPERLKMLKLFTQNWDVTGVTFERAVKVSEGLSGAHVRDLCLTAAMKAIEAGSLDENEIAVVTDKHFAAAVKEVRDKDYSTYMQAQSRKKSPMGFGGVDDDDDDY